MPPEEAIYSGKWAPSIARVFSYLRHERRCIDPKSTIFFSFFYIFRKDNNNNQPTAFAEKMSYSWYQPRDPSVDRMYRPRPDRQLCLDDVIEDESESEHNSETKSSWGSTNSLAGTTATSSSCVDRANVYLRLRPLQPVHTRWQDYTVVDNSTLVIQTNGASNRIDVERQFVFSGIFDATERQRDVYRQSVKSMVENDNDAVVLTYGTSGSGKTYTILGDSENPGLIPRAVHHLFQRYKENVRTTPLVKVVAGKLQFLSDEDMLREEVNCRELVKFANSTDCAFDVTQMLDCIDREEDFVPEHLPNTGVYVWISFLEIYNERVYDLLSLKGQQHEHTMSNNINGTRPELKVAMVGDTACVKELKSVFVRSAEDVIRILNYGMSNVSHGATSINNNSSRSHCILNVDVIVERNGFMFTQYKFGDLAGSERLKKTCNVGNRLREAQHINNSLLVLSRCMDVLQANRTKRKKDLVPYRESKLTMIIKAALQGLENFVMLVSLLPAQEFVEENLHVLNFASIAKELSMKPITEVLRRQRKHRISMITSFTTTNSSRTETETELYVESNWKIDRFNIDFNCHVILSYFQVVAQ